MKKLMVLFLLPVLLMSGCIYSSVDDASGDSTLSSEEMRIMEKLNTAEEIQRVFSDIAVNVTEATPEK